MCGRFCKAENFTESFGIILHYCNTRRCNASTWRLSKTRRVSMLKYMNLNLIEIKKQIDKMEIQ